MPKRPNPPAVLQKPEGFRGLDALARFVAAVVDRAMRRKPLARKTA